MSTNVKKPHFVAARLYRLKGLRALRGQQDHANRLDETSRLRHRKEGNPCETLAFNPWLGDRPAYPAAPFDYLGDFDRMLAQREIKTRGNAAGVAHFIFQVSKEWISEVGSLHDPLNPRNMGTFECAIGWAYATFGKDSILSARMDMDETGGGTVDVFVCAEAGTKLGKKYISISPALRRLQTRYGSRNTFVALQDCVAEYAQAHLDPALQRGNPKEGKGPDRVSPENYKARAINERRRERLETVRQGNKGRRAALRAEAERLEREASRLSVLDATLSRRSGQLDEQRLALYAKEAAVARQAAELAKTANGIDATRRLQAAQEAEMISKQKDVEAQAEKRAAEQKAEQRALDRRLADVAELKSAAYLRAEGLKADDVALRLREKKIIERAAAFAADKRAHDARVEIALDEAKDRGLKQALNGAQAGD